MKRQAYLLVLAILATCMMVTGAFGAGRVVVYSTNQQAQNDMMAAEFEKATGIKCEMVRAGSGITLKRIRAEKDRPLGDVFRIVDERAVSFAEDLPQADDQTLVLLRRLV